MRIKHGTRDLLDREAVTTGKNLTDFVLDAARQAARNALVVTLQDIRAGLG